jgi:hypothetical protein
MAGHRGKHGPAVVFRLTGVGLCAGSGACVAWADVPQACVTHLSVDPQLQAPWTAWVPEPALLELSPPSLVCLTPEGAQAVVTAGSGGVIISAVALPALTPQLAEASVGMYSKLIGDAITAATLEHVRTAAVRAAMVAPLCLCLAARQRIQRGLPSGWRGRSRMHGPFADNGGYWKTAAARRTRGYRVAGGWQGSLHGGGGPGAP